MVRRESARPLAVSIVGCVALCLVWSLVTPLMASYDEPAHLYAAAAIVRGQVDPPLELLEPLGELHRVRIPSGIADLQHVADCLVGHPELPATCAAEAGPGGHTQYARYPQLYYVAVGWPTLLVDGRLALRAARALTALLMGTFLGLGLWLLRRYHRGAWVRLGAVVALTPTVTSMGGTVNSGALEMGAAFATWCGLLAMASRGRDDELPPALVWATGGSLAVFIVSRPISPLWAGLTVAAVLAVIGPSGARRWLADRTVRRVVVLGAVALVVAVAWVGLIGRPPLLQVPGQPTTGDALAAVRGKLVSRLLGLSGDFLGLRSPVWMAALSVAGLGVLAVAAVRHRARLVPVAVALVVLVVVASVAIEVSQFSKIGLWWQTRYSVPPLLGVPLLLAGAGAGRVEPGWARRWVPVAAVVIQGSALVWVLHRYASGVWGPWWVGDFAWNPPLGRFGIVVAVALACALFARAFAGRWASSDPPAIPPSEGELVTLDPPLTGKSVTSSPGAPA